MNGHNSMYNLLMGNNPVSTLPNSYNALGRTFGLSPANSANNGADDNFFAKRGKSIENAIGTTGAALVSAIDSTIEDKKSEEILKNANQAERDILNKYGYNNRDEYYDKLDALEAAGDTENYNNLVNTVGAEIKNLYDTTHQDQEKRANNWADYRNNSYVGQKVNQDQGKFLGSAINTLSTAFDVMAPGAGVLANSVQGGIEGVADELEQNGFNNFDWGRAGQNALIGATTGAVTGGLNKGVSNALAKNGGNLFKGGNAITRGLNNLGSSTAAGRIGSTLATGAARGALSGAVGGATGAGLSAAMNGQDVLGSAIQGAQQGFGQGALAGGIMAGANMAASRAPVIGDAMQKFNEAGQDWNARKANGESFGERLAGTWQDSPTRDFLNSTRSGFIQIPVATDTTQIRTKSGYTADDLINLANSQKDQFVNDVREITAENSGIPNESFFDTAVKTNVDRINQKIRDKNGAAPTDMLRSTIMVKDPNSSLESIIKSFENRGYKIYNNDITNRYTDGSTGYKDIALKFVKGDDDSIVKEIQIMTPNMQKAKYELGGHELYEKVRVKAPGWEDAVAKMNQLYAEAERADAAALNSSADTSRPSFAALSGGNSEPAEVYPATSSPSRTTLTGTPSTMKYFGNSVDVISNSPFNSSVAQNSRFVNGGSEPFMAYGESNLANRTRRGMVADSLERLGNTLEGAQTNVTRAAAKDIGIESTGKVVENVRKKTGITNLETQAKIARELTGGENSLMDSVQRNAIYTRDDGIPYRVDTTPVLDEVESIVNKYADSNTFGSQKAKDQFIYNLKKDISNQNADVLSVAGRMKGTAADLRGKGVGEIPPKDLAQSKIYSEIASKLDDLSYSVIPQENVDAMFDATINEMRARATQAANNGNKDIYRAYTQLANSLDSQPRTVKAFRNFKKDFVDISKINYLTGLAENGAAAQMGRSFGGGAKRLFSTLAQRPVNTLLAKAGGSINNVADRVGNTGGDSGAPINVAPLALSSGEISAPSTRVYDAIGRTEGLSNAEQARTADYLVDAVQEAEIVPANNGNTLESLMTQPMVSNDTNVYNSLYGNGRTSNLTTNQSSGLQNMNQNAGAYNSNGLSYYPQTGDYWTDILGIAMTSSINDGDYDTFGALYEMYQDSLSKLQSQQKSSTSSSQKLTSTQQRANAAMDSLNRLSNMTPDLGYNLSGIPIIGGIATLGGNDYEGEAKSLAQQIGYMVSGANIKEEEAYNIGKAYVPQPFDSEQTRNLKLQRAYSIIRQYQNGTSEEA